jgi:hypothetical protein
MRAFSTTRRRRRAANLGILAATMTLGTLALGAPSVTAEIGVPGTCNQDGFMPTPSALVENGAQKDRNGNGFVCAKFEDSRIVGGPEDDAIL